MVEQLEIERPQVVTAEDLTRLVGLNSRLPPFVAADRLVRLGWLLPLRTRHAWEFAPAARGGALSGGDPHIELRAALALRPEMPVALAFDTALVLWGFATHAPDRHVLATPGVPFSLPTSLSEYQAVRLRWRLFPHLHNGLPVWRPATILAGLAVRPTACGDWGNWDEWLAPLAKATAVEDVLVELEQRPVAAWARAGHLADLAGVDDLSTAIRQHRPAVPAGPVYLGDRDRKGWWDQAWRVRDSVTRFGMAY